MTMAEVLVPSRSGMVVIMTAMAKMATTYQEVTAAVAAVLVANPAAVMQ